jgi:hypothetical protein
MWQDGRPGKDLKAMLLLVYAFSSVLLKSVTSSACGSVVEHLPSLCTTNKK